MLLDYIVGHKQTVQILWTSEQPLAETATYITQQNKTGNVPNETILKHVHANMFAVEK
jgi:hypothetical protein